MREPVLASIVLKFTEDDYTWYTLYAIVNNIGKCSFIKQQSGVEEELVVAGVVGLAATPARSLVD